MDSPPVETGGEYEGESVDSDEASGAAAEETREDGDAKCDDEDGCADKTDCVRSINMDDDDDDE